MDTGDLLTVREVDRFLRLIGRSRSDPRVVLLRLAVSTEEAMRRKTTVRVSYVRASNLGWQPTPVRGEVVIDTDGKSAQAVLREAEAALRTRVGRALGKPLPRVSILRRQGKIPRS
jgi:hypothetical protein